MRYDDNPVVGYYNHGEAISCGLYEKYALLGLDTTQYSEIHLFDDVGRRIYRHSLSFLFCYACYLALPGRNIRIGHSLGDGFYFSFTDEEPVSKAELESIRKQMASLVADALPISYTRVSYSDIVSILKKQNMPSTASLFEFKNEPEVAVYKINDYYDIAYEPLVCNTSVLSCYEIYPYTEKGILLRYPTSSNLLQVGPLKDNPKLFNVFDEYKKWGKLLKVTCVADLNRLIYEGTIEEYIRKSEALHRIKLSSVAQSIIRNKKSAVFIAGPSSSGKTTFAIKLCELLTLMGCNVIRISLDNYYKARVDVPVDENGEKDYECIEALYVDKFHQDMRAIYNGEEVALPVWDFTTQVRSYTEPVKLDNKTVFIIEGIHALNPLINGVVKDEEIFKIYISALTQLNLDDHNRISTTDNRIIRRIVRDFRTRGASAVRTLNMWKSVERGERLYIFPYQNLADVNFNSASDYELSVLAPYVKPLLKVIKPNSGVAYTMARRLLAFLENFYEAQTKFVPSDSILREFIGESDYGAV